MTIPASSTLIFQPGGVPAGNVFTSFAALAAAASTMPGKKRIVFDSSLAPCTIPAGAYAIGPSAWEAATAAGTKVTFSDGATFDTIPSSFSEIAIDNQNQTSPAFPPVTTFAFVQIHSSNCALFTVFQSSGAAAKPIFEAASGGQIFILAQRLLTFSPNALPCFTADAGGTLLFFLSVFSTLQANSIGGGGAIQVALCDLQSTVNATQASAFTRIAGPSVNLGFTDAAPALVPAVADPQSAITTLKTKTTLNVGVTGSRPAANLQAGQAYFDSTLGKPIWRNAANSGWVDATGTAV